MAEAILWLLVLVGIVLAVRYVRFDRPNVGSAAAGTIYDWLNEDKRKAIEIVVEGRAEQRDGEHADDVVETGEPADGRER
jgi:hypothetical protein